MTKDDLNPNQEAEDEKSEPKPDEGSDSEQMSDEEFEAILNGEESDEEESSEESSEKEESEEESEEESSDKESFDEDKFVKEYNKRFNTNFKSFEAIQESQKHLRRAASGKGKTETAKPKTSNVEAKFAEDLLLARFPKASYVMDELKEEAERTGKTVLEIYKSSKFIQKEAEVRAEEDNVDKSNSKKVNIPDSGSSAKEIDFTRMSSEQFKKYKEKVLSRA